MTARPVVGVAGAGGAAGAAAVRALAGGYRLRLGARRPAALDPLLRAAGPGAVAVPLDVEDQASVDAFCAGCQAVVNCVGFPAERYLLARAAGRAGAGYVDAGGDERLADRLSRPGTAPVVLGAGVLPGLSGMMPRWLVRQGLGPPYALTVYVSVRDHLTASSAAELLSSVDGEPLAGPASGVDGAPGGRSAAGPAGHRFRSPLLPGDLLAYPFRGVEVRRLARAVPLAGLAWFQVFDAHGPVLAALARLRAAPPAAGAIADLCRAAELEMFGRPACTRLLYQLDGCRGGTPASQVAVLRLGGTYEATGTVCALAVGEVLAGAVPPGAHFAAEVLAADLVDRLPGRPGVAGLDLWDGSLPEYSTVDEGAL